MKEKNTARVCREQLTEILGKGDIKLNGIDMEQVTLYVRMNKNLTSNIGRLWRYLPFRKKTGGVEPGMASDGAKKTKGENEQWLWPKGEIPEKERIELIGVMLEIGVRVLFKNLVYSFGGEHYLQKEGGPIGVRGTGAVS